MQTVSARWDPTNAVGLVSKVSITYGGSLVADSIAISDGTVSVDRGSETRRSLSLTVPDPSQFPISPTDPLSVYGQRAVVEAGYRYLDNSTEMVPVGVFVITQVDGDVHLGPLTITGASLEMLLKLTIAEVAFTANDTDTPANVITALLAETDPDLTLVDNSTHGATTLATTTWDVGTSYLQIAQDVAAAIGAELYCDAAGTFILADIPVVSSPPVSAVWSIDAGQTGVMISETATLTSDDVYNRVIVAAENAADDVPPVSGTATITDTSDPLHYGGPFGKRVIRLTSSLVTIAAQAQVMATAELEKRRAPNRSVTVETLPNHALEPGDWIRVAPLSRAAVSPELYLSQSFSLPLIATGATFSIETLGGHGDSETS